MSDGARAFEAWLGDEDPALPAAGWDPETVLHHALVLEVTDRRQIANAMALVDTAGRFAAAHPEIPYQAIADAMLAGALPEALPEWARSYWRHRLRLLLRYRPEPVGWRLRRRWRKLAGAFGVRATAATTGVQGRKPKPGAVVWEPKTGDDDWPNLLSGE